MRDPYTKFSQQILVILSTFHWNWNKSESQAPAHAKIWLDVLQTVHAPELWHGIIMPWLSTEYDVARNSHVLHSNFSISHATSYSVNSHTTIVHVIDL